VESGLGDVLEEASEELHGIEGLTATLSTVVLSFRVIENFARVGQELQALGLSCADERHWYPLALGVPSASGSDDVDVGVPSQEVSGTPQLPLNSKSRIPQNVQTRGEVRQGDGIIKADAWNTDLNPMAMGAPMDG
jgi:hypothetical protein